MTNLELGFEETQQTVKETIEPVLKEFVANSKASEQELSLNPYLRLKTGINKDKATDNDYDNVGLVGKCYKDTWFRLITTMKKVYRFQLKVAEHELREKVISEIPGKYEHKIDQQYYLSFDIPKDDKLFVQFLKDIKTPMMESYRYLCENEKVPLVYSCCSKYLECSNAKKCVQESIDVKYAKGCAYRKNLKSGKIFYGKNKNA